MDYEFGDRRNLNDTSIGIEIVNLGIKSYDETEKKYGFFIPEDKYIEFEEGQIKKLAFIKRIDKNII